MTSSRRRNAFGKEFVDGLEIANSLIPCRTGTRQENRIGDRVPSELSA
jgi:hypothetical protein